MFLSELFNDLIDIHALGTFIALAAATILLICWRTLSIGPLDPREPPILKPKIPYVGHILGTIREQSGYYDMLYARHPMPIATMPLINAKLYVAFSAKLAQACLRNKDLSFHPFMLDFSQRMLGVNDNTMAPVLRPATATEPSFLDCLIRDMHGAMQGEHLQRMNVDVLNEVAGIVEGELLDGNLEVDGIYYWLRRMLTLASSTALWGSHNPFKADPSLIDKFWIFEANVLKLLYGSIPAYFAAEARHGRTAIQHALGEYYAAKHDLEPDVAQLTKVRAALCRRNNIADSEIGKFELGLILVAVGNAIPTTFWFLVFIASDPTLVTSIREELMTITSKESLIEGKREVTLDISKFDAKCPLLVSCYKETMRLVNAQQGIRRIMRDTTISDGANTYLLKEDNDIQLPAGVSHLSAVWGPKPTAFSATRFLAPSHPLQESEIQAEAAKELDKERKRSYFPFGAGKHLCPGRHFAFAEILGTAAMLLLKFDMATRDGRVLEVPALGRPLMAEAIAKPTGEGLELGARFACREGWDGVVWKFKT